MKLKKLYLRGYKPLALNNIHIIEIDIETAIILILGTNGSGKSSLLREANPLPASCQDYSEDGEKRSIWEHQGDEYELISYLKKSGRHTFIKNSEIILNEVTATVFREHVMKEFNYSPIVHRLLIGEVRFSSMTPAARREILTMISPLDLKFALQLYGSIKERVRDNQAILKHLVAKGSDAKAKLLELNIPEDADQQKLEIEQQLGVLIPYTTSRLPSADSVDQEIDYAYNQLKQIKLRLERFDNTRIPSDDIQSLDDLNQYIGECSGNIATTQNNINNLTAEVESLSGITNSIIDHGLSMEDLQARIQHIESELTECRVTCYVNSNHDRYLATMVDVSDWFERIFAECRDIRIMNLISRKEAADLNQEIVIRVTNAESTIRYQTGQLKHYSDSAVMATCPKCQLDFNIRGVTADQKTADIRAIIAEQETLLVSLRKELEASNLVMRDVRGYEQLAQEILNIKRAFTLPYDFWDRLGYDEDILTNHSRVRQTINNWRANIELGKRQLELTEELVSYQKALDLMVRYGGSVDTKLANLQEAIVTELRRKRQLEKQLVNARNLLRNIQTYTELAEQGDALLKDLARKFRLATDIAIQNDAKRNCDRLYSRLASSQHILNQRNSLQASIKEMEEEYLELVSEREALQLLEENLSPTKGLIADQMLGFISSYLEQINLICNELWAYQLNVGLCHMDNGVLDYSFPLLVENETISDISKGSTGQIEVIDLAFTIVMRQYLHLNDYPMYLDETGSGFDEMHRNILMQYIKTIHGSNQASQLFMVNHYVNVHGGLSNHDTVVLDDRNITVPSSYNERTKITYKK